MKGAQLAKTVKRTQSTLHLIYKISVLGYGSLWYLNE